MKWLFKTYPKSVIKKVFVEEPLKIYTPQKLNFTKEILLKVNKNLDRYLYDRDLPRCIRGGEEKVKTSSLPLFDKRDIAADKAYTVGRRPAWRDYVDFFSCLKAAMFLLER